MTSISVHWKNSGQGCKVFISALLLLLLFQTPVRADLLYRYIGDNDEVVIDDNIPPRFVPKGYSVLNRQGVVIERVEPALTEQQRAQAAEQLRLVEEQKAQERADLELRQRYIDTSGAVRARDRQTGAFETLIVVAQANLNKLKENEIRELEFAADAERRDREVPSEVLESLQRIRAQIRETEMRIAHHRDEQQRMRNQFDIVIRRLQEIEEVRSTTRR